MLMGRSVSSQRLARVWIMFLLVCREETRGFSWSVHAYRRLQCRLVAWHCAWCQGLVAASPLSPHSLLQFFLHVVQSALGGPLVNSLLRNHLHYGLNQFEK